MSRTFEPRPIVFGGPLSPGVRTILFATVGVYVFQVAAGMVAQTRLEPFFGLVPYDVTHHLYLWQLVTYLFLHDSSLPGGVFHILFNMLALWMFGTELEWLWGTPRFLRFYFATGIGAALCSTLVSPASTIPIIGASGAIYGLLAAYGLLFPDRILLLYFVIPIKAKYFVLIMGAISFWFSVTSGGGGGVAHVAHLGGMIFGWLYLRGFRSWRGVHLPLRQWRERWRRERLRRKFKVYYKETRGGDEGPEE